MSCGKTGAQATQNLLLLHLEDVKAGKGARFIPTLGSRYTPRAVHRHVHLRPISGTAERANQASSARPSVYPALPPHRDPGSHKPPPPRVRGGSGSTSPLPNPMRRSLTLLILVLLEQWRLLKETFSLFLILVGFPQALVLIILFLSDLTTSHDSPFWWLSRMTSSSNLLHPAALWHNLGKSASHLCL